VLFDNMLHTRRIDMRFISVFTHGPSQRHPTEAEGAGMLKLIEEGMKAGWLLGIDGVDDDVTGVRVNKDSDGEITVIDGPFAEAKEVIGGYALLSAANKEEAVEHTRRLLEHVYQGTWEIYQLYDMGK
jgi:hypothetical protein